MLCFLLKPSSVHSLLCFYTPKLLLAKLFWLIELSQNAGRSFFWRKTVECNFHLWPLFIGQQPSQWNNDYVEIRFYMLTLMPVRGDDTSPSKRSGLVRSLVQYISQLSFAVRCADWSYGSVFLRNRVSWSGLSSGPFQIKNFGVQARWADLCLTTTSHKQQAFNEKKINYR